MQCKSWLTLSSTLPPGGKLLTDSIWHLYSFPAGIATALKILFSARDCSGAVPSSSDLPFGDELVLERNEVIALVNLLARFSNSLEWYHKLTAELQREQGVPPSIADKAAVV